MAITGIVKSVSGNVTATDVNGIVRTLRVGDRVSADETISTGNAAGTTISIAFSNGTQMDLGGGSVVALNEDMLTPDASGSKEAAGQSSQQAQDDVARMQEAIAKGEDFDPSKLPATAAGGAAGGTGGGNEGHTFVQVDYLNPRITPDSGFNTTGISVAFPVQEDVLILNPAQPVPSVPLPGISISVAVDVDVSIRVDQPGVGGITIIPGDAPVPLAAGVTGASILEGSNGDYPVTFLILLDQVSTQPVTITYTIIPGTATYGLGSAGGDLYDGGLTGTVTIPAGAKGFTVTEFIVGDTKVEGDETFTIVLSNPIGATLTNDTATVTIIDDDHAPVAINDTSSMTEDNVSVSGNVLTNDMDADGQTLSVIGTPITLTNQFGGLVINSTTGEYTFTMNEETKAAAQALNDGETITVLFPDAYKVTDGANESNLANVTITINGVTDTQTVTVHAAGGEDTTVYETALLQGVSELSNPALNSDPREVVSGSFTVSATDGIAKVTIVGTDFTLAQLQAIQTSGTPSAGISTGQGTLVITGYTSSDSNHTGTISYTYTLTGTVTNATAADSFFDDTNNLITVTGVSGSTSAAADLVIRIMDDAPVANDDAGGTVTEDVGTTLSGNVLDNDVQGADQTATPTAEFMGWTAVGHDNAAAMTALNSFGTFTHNADGSWSYALNNSLATTQALTASSNSSYDIWYTTQDNDGDTFIAKLTISIQGADDTQTVTVHAAGGEDTTVYETALLQGVSELSNPALNSDPREVVSGSFTVSATDGIAKVTIVGTDFTLAQLQAIQTSGTPSAGISTGQGTLVITGYTSSDSNHTGTISYTYTLTGTVTNATAADSFFDDTNNLITVTGVSGSTSAAADLVIRIMDDAPVVNHKTSLIYANSSNDGAGSATGGTGIYEYRIGADGRTSYDSTHSDFSSITLSGSIGANAITVTTTPTWVSESASLATFTFAFDYAKDPTAPGTLTHETGTLIFDKMAGTYTVELSAPIEAFSTLTTSQATAYTGYGLGSNILDTTQPAVMVATLASNFYIQFTGDQQTGGKSPVNFSAGGDTVYTSGETIAAADSWVSISGAANGVGGDTIGQGEVLDFNFYNSDPTGVVGGVATQSASTMYMRFDNWGNSEDLVVILKLYDTVTHSTTTQAIVIDHNDVLTSANTLPVGYTGIATLDNNDGLVIIESNDYNTAGTHWVIVGGQLLSSIEGLSGSGIDLNSTTGSSGASTGTESFGAITTDADVIKVSDIGVITQTTSTQDANLAFTVTNVDADGDTTAPTTLNVTIEGSNTLFTGTASSEMIQGTSNDDILFGGGGNDVLIGGAGHDTLYLGMDMGASKSIVDGQTDIVKLSSVDLASGSDKVYGFDTSAPAASGAGAGGDVLNISDLLTGTGVTDLNTAVSNGYVSFTADAGSGGTTVNVDITGSGASYQPVATFADVAFSTQPDMQTLLQDNIQVTPPM